jgi:RNA polymerase sigma-70 factor (ECF subfamily)
MRLAGDGHHPALETIFTRHRRGALALAVRICGSGLAEEAVQEAFLQVLRGTSAYRAQLGSVRNWMLGIVHHRAIDAVRRDARHAHRRAGAEELNLLPSAEQLDVMVERRHEARTVRAMLGFLPGDQARVIAMAYFGELSHTEIATLTGLPVGTVKSRIRLGLARLREPMGVVRAPVIEALGPAST